MMNADVSFLDRICDRAVAEHPGRTHPVNLQQLRFLTGCFLTGCFAIAIALLDVHLSTPGCPLAGGAPHCRPGYPAEGWVVHLNTNWYKS